MKIKRVDIMGFKSFPERVQVPFPEGISAIVGPNGCGKSNIVDAIRWVMGEQSPKQLRGRQMEDILFNGAKTHQPAGLAEVTLLLSNENGGGAGLSLGPSEISITRRLYRSGDSEYLINKVPCRLKDIIQFFMDTGMGTKAYAVIEQGRIGYLVDAKPEERRQLIDEAAGITRYKAQKKEAERKIEAAEQNLIHIAAVMAETKRQINSLTRAAAKAVRYKKLKSEFEELDLTLARMDLFDLEVRRQELAAKKSGLEARLSGLLADCDRVEVELEKARLEIVDQEKSVETEAARLNELQIEHQKLRQEEEFNRKQAANNQARQERLTEELTRLAGQSREKSGQLDSLKEEMSGLGRLVEEKSKAREEIRTEGREIRRQHDLTAARRDELSRDLTQIRARMVRLEETLAGYERMSEVQSARREEIRVELEGLETEISQAAGQIQTLTQKKEQRLQDLTEARAKAGQARREQGLLQAEVEKLAAQEQRLKSELDRSNSRLAALKDIQAHFGWYPQGVQALMASAEMRQAGVIGPVAERFKVPSGYESAVEAALGERLHFILVHDRQTAVQALNFLKAKDLGRCGFVSLSGLEAGADGDLLKALLGDYVLVDSLEEAVKINSGRAALTRQGEYVSPRGLIVGGLSPQEDQGLLARLREIEELEKAAGLLLQEREQAAELLRLEAEKSAAAAQAVQQVEATLRSLESELIGLDKEGSLLERRRTDLESRKTKLNQALAEQSAEAERLLARKESARSERQASEDQEFDLIQELERITEEVELSSSALEAARERDQQAAIELSTLSERLSTTRRAVDQAEAWLKDIEVQKAAREQEHLEAKTELQRLTERRQVVAEEIEKYSRRLVQAEDEVKEQRRRLDQVREKLNVTENEARQARKLRAEGEDDVRKVELDLQETNLKRQALQERIAGQYRFCLLLPAQGPRPGGPELQPEEARVRRDDLRLAIEGLGEVNLTADTEHEALQERYDFYKAQVADLTQAIEDLKNSIAKINRTCKIRFSSTFQAVDQKLREIFPLLFEGGEAWLSLTDENDPLDSGVEIHVHPPGKRLTVMSLLSGGEKALVALALIFALYLIKPSPFCLLDETDAPLDEANIDRFNRLLTKLGQSSQIILVTHNKRTMQISQTLYGVTMEEPGVSKMVSVNLSELEEFQEDAKMVQTG